MEKGNEIAGVDPAIGTSLEGTSSTGGPVGPTRHLSNETEAAEALFCLDAEGTVWWKPDGSLDGPWVIESTLKQRVDERNWKP